MQYDITKRVPRTDQPEIGYILIFDQFEELFTYPKDDVKELGKELLYVIFRVGEQFLKLIENKDITDSQLLSAGDTFCNIVLHRLKIPPGRQKQNVNQLFQDKVQRCCIE